MGAVRVLELGNYVSVAYAGMILAEQGHEVVKWTDPKGKSDPIFDLIRGDEFWEWINEGKTLVERPLSDLASLEGYDEYGYAHWDNFDIVIDNLRPSTLARYVEEPDDVAGHYGLRWVSLRSEVGDRSFDVVAQARAWGVNAPWVPFYIGDTTAGLWMAFKALAGREAGHFVIGQATVLAKLVEGELVLDAERRLDATVWDVPEEYRMAGDAAEVFYKGVGYVEPKRDDEWRRKHLWHDNGRYRV